MCTFVFESICICHILFAHLFMNAFCMCIHMHMHIFVITEMYMHLCIHLYVLCMHVFVTVYMHIYACVHVHVCLSDALESIDIVLHLITRQLILLWPWGWAHSIRLAELYPFPLFLTSRKSKKSA